MGNVNDYLLWRGDIPINKETGFNEVDSLILARFSYLRFDKIKLEEKETIESISNKMKNLKNEEFRYNGDKELITYLGESTRFKNMLVTDYIKINDNKAEKQFGAVTIHISDDEMYISYIGTDSTINGWKEDFNMAFMDNVPCQLAGKDYIEKIAKQYSNKKIRIGGHSKGGNVAIYSALTSSKEIKNRIIKVNNYDGPGFSKSFISEYEDDKIFSKMETYIPQDSIIGRILNHKEKMIVSLSTEKGILQHDIFSWQVLGCNLIKSEKTTENSEIFNDTVTEWLETTTTKQRKIFIDSIFELFSSTDANTFGDIKRTISKSIPRILEKYKEIAEEDRKVMTDMLKVFVMSYLNVVKEKETLKIENKKEEFKSLYSGRFAFKKK